MNLLKICGGDLLMISKGQAQAQLVLLRLAKLEP